MPIALFLQAIQALTGSQFVKDKLQRSEHVIRVLKAVGIDPEHPPEDFEAVYAYALVEYGYGKPDVCLEIFRAREIRSGLRRSFDGNDPQGWLTIGEAFLASSEIGEKVRSVGCDPKRELAEFAAAFLKVTRRSQTPKETLVQHQLRKIERTIDRKLEQVAGQLEALKNPAALSPEETLTLASANCRAAGLGGQMREWFEVLGFRLEGTELWEVDFFEWVINIPKRRGFDRVLVRGIAGEAGVRDVLALRESVVGQRTDEGWLVSARRISQAARVELDKAENEDLLGLTFDELLDQDADFGGYVDWLEREIVDRKVEARYVPLACSKEEFDPVTHQRLGVSQYGEGDGWTEGYIDLWLDDPAKEHLSILGEFGTGKTWLTLHYALTALRSYQDAKNRGAVRPRLPIVIPLRDYAKAVSVESLFSEFFFRKHEIPIPGYSAFEKLNRMGKLLLIFDGFDEMAARVDKQQMINNFWELAKVVVPGSKVILTCRTEHFPEAREGRSLLNAELQASTRGLSGETPQFEVLELEKFGDEQIRRVLGFSASEGTIAQVMGNPQLLDLARRPVMTELILEALPDIEAGKPVDMSRVYLYAVRRKMERDIRAERTFTSMADKLYFLCELSWEMLSNDRMSLNYREFPDRIRKLFGSAVQEEKDLDHWHYDMMGQTMLIRNSDGDYQPAHRSLLEFFVAFKFAAELGALAPDFLELAQMKSGIDKSLEPRDYTWSEYFGGRAVAPLKGFVTESLEVLRSGFGKEVLSKALLDLLKPILSEHSINHFLVMLNDLFENQLDQTSYTSGNIINLLIHLDPLALAGKNLSNIIIRGANFTQSILQNTNLSQSIFADCTFSSESGRTHSIQFSNNNEFFATGESSGDIRLWRTLDGQQTSILKGHKDWVRCILFNLNGSILFSSSDDQEIRIWDLKNGRCIEVLAGHQGRVYSLQLTADQSTLVSVSNDRSIKIWSLSSYICIKTLLGHHRSVNSIKLIEDDKFLVTCSDDKTIKIWDMQSKLCIQTLEDHTDEVLSIVYLAKCNMIASSSKDKTVKIWDWKTGQCYKTLSVNSDISCLVYSEIKDLLIGGTELNLMIWDAINFEYIDNFPGSASTFNSISITSDSQILASASYESGFSFWNLETKECFKHITGNIVPAYSVSMDKESRILVTCSNKRIIIWDFKTGDFLKILSGHEDVIWEIDISPCDGFLVSTSADKTAKIWNIDTGECIRTLRGHTNRIYSVTFSPDGKSIATASADGSVRVWDTHSGKCIHILKGHSEKVWAVRFSQDGNFISSGSRDKTIKIWSFNTGECLKTLGGGTDNINCFAFSSKDNLLASAGHDKIIKIWNFKSGECLLTLEGHSSRINSLAFDSENYWLLSGGSDSLVKIWDLNTQTCIKEFTEDVSPVWAISLNRNNKLVAVGSLDSSVKVWDIETGICLKRFYTKFVYEGMNITGVKGLTPGTISTLKALGAVEDEE